MKKKTPFVWKTNRKFPLNRFLDLNQHVVLIFLSFVFVTNAYRSYKYDPVGKQSSQIRSGTTGMMLLKHAIHKPVHLIQTSKQSHIYLWNLVLAMIIYHDVF